MGYKINRLWFAPIYAGLFSFLTATIAQALPFNDDMVGGQLMSGTIMRPHPAGSVPIGSLDRKIPSYEAALSLVNPLKGDKPSAIRGRRLFAVNCSPCHGSYQQGQYTQSAIADKGMPSVNLSDPGLLYFDGEAKQKFKPDGHIFGYVYFGGLALMPAYGWKLSNTEIWDIVNYVRTIQAVDSSEVDSTAVSSGKVSSGPVVSGQDAPQQGAATGVSKTTLASK